MHLYMWVIGGLLNLNCCLLYVLPEVRLLQLRGHIGGMCLFPLHSSLSTQGLWRVFLFISFALCAFTNDSNAFQDKLPSSVRNQIKQF
jgi:hypothetical protein